MGGIVNETAGDRAVDVVAGLGEETPVFDTQGLPQENLAQSYTHRG
jgi:hypothetical protein